MTQTPSQDAREAAAAAKAAVLSFAYIDDSNRQGAADIIEDAVLHAFDHPRSGLNRLHAALTPQSPTCCEAERWQPIETAPKDMKSGKFLVTNNPRATSAHGQMTHVWLTSMVHKGDGDYSAFVDGHDFRKVEFLTHWLPLRLSFPEPPATAIRGADHG